MIYLHNCRHRAGKQPKIALPPSPGVSGAIEAAMSRAKNRPGELVFEPVLGMIFDSPEEAYEFYNLYSWEIGFGIIYNHYSTRSNDKNYRIMQEFTCQKGV